MRDDDLEPQRVKKPLKNLEPMSVAELEIYLSELESEKQRATAEIARKKAYLDSVSSLFKK